ncbi:Spherulation-specific family 4-domain-containing protein [Coniochaeta sp. 2T2.1]|nr:Spherulation-specific family 4-domain-containing protein [Coniochaeta sp. 2T2.1]
MLGSRAALCCARVVPGIFFDEGWMECGPHNIYADFYKYINDKTERKDPGAYTMLNPGSPIASSYEDTMDTLLIFELSYEAYTQSYKGNNWPNKDPRKIWHIVYNVPASAIDEVAKLAKERGAGIIQITNDIMPNPYDNLPDDSYMQAHLAAVGGGSVPSADTHAWPSDKGSAGAVASLVVAHGEYSSAALLWNAASNAVGYHVYDKGILVAGVPSDMTSITIGGVPPGTAHTFTVTAVGSGGTTGPSSPSASTTTMSLPGGKPVTQASASILGSMTTIKADILVPYAFLCIYIWDSLECDFQENPGWPINYKATPKTLHRYTGDPLPEGSTAAPWKWTNITDIVVDTTGYTYTWTLPLGTSTTDTSKFVVQAQGYGPYINVFDPAPDDYDCKGSGLCGGRLPIC